MELPAGTGVDAPRAWDNLIAAGRPGGKGVKIAVLDSGVAYDRSPDLVERSTSRAATTSARASGARRARLRGEDAEPDDDYGHGTHVASTIAETTNNGKGLTGLAYGATIIPVKVLNRYGDGDEDSIAKGLRYAADQRRAGDQPELRVRLLDDVGVGDPADRRRRPVRARARAR